MNQSYWLLIHISILLYVDVVYYSYGMNGKAHVGKYEDVATKQGY